MGTFAKIFIVVNLVLAVVFLGAAATLLGTAENWKEKYTTETADLNETLQSKNQEIRTLNDQVSSLRTEKNGALQEKQNLETLLASKDKEWRELVQKFNGVIEDLKVQSKTISDLKDDLASARQDNTNLQTQLDEQTARARSAKESEDNVRSDLEREQVAHKRTKADLAASEKEKAALAEKYDKASNLINMIKERIGSDVIAGIQPMEAIEGVVTGIDEELNIVLVSVGSDDDVKVGYTMTVFRGGEYVGVLVIDKVGPDWASGHMDQSKSKSFPQRGDDVATQL